MILKKSLKTGQATLEYFILFALMLGITLLAMNPAFLSNVRKTLQGDGSPGSGYSYKVADRIIGAAGNIASIIIPPIVMSAPETIEEGPEFEPIPKNADVAKGDSIKSAYRISCPGIIYSNKEQAGKEPRLNNALQLDSKNGTAAIIIEYHSEFSTSEEMPNKLLQVKMKDINLKNGSSDLDILVKYAGENCQAGAPTMDDYDRILTTPDFKDGDGGFFLSTTGAGSGENKDVQLHLSGVATGCFYVMVVNKGTGKAKDKVYLEIAESITNNDGQRKPNYNAGECFKKN